VVVLPVVVTLPVPAIGASTPMGTMVVISTAITFFERRLTRGVFAIVQPEFAYVQSKRAQAERTGHSGFLNIKGGVRWVINPNAPVEVGLSHVLYASLRDDTYEYASNVWAKSKSKSVGVDTSLVAERMLLPQLWVRVAVSMLTASWSQTTTTLEPNDTYSLDGVSRSFGVQLTVSPSLSLRLAF